MNYVQHMFNHLCCDPDGMFVMIYHFIHRVKGLLVFTHRFSENKSPSWTSLKPRLQYWAQSFRTDQCGKLHDFTTVYLPIGKSTTSFLFAPKAVPKTQFLILAVYLLFSYKLLSTQQNLFFSLFVVISVNWEFNDVNVNLIKSKEFFFCGWVGGVEVK